jgi:branched-chain amino acid transport system ATP-binding protein
MSVLEIKNATKQFGKLVAVNDVSLTVEPGELRAIIGPNGAGKTTFFNLISGFFPPTAGTILFEGRDITAMPEHQRVKLGMARTFQVTEIFPERTVRENLRVPVEVAAGLQLSPWMKKSEKIATAARIEELMALGGLEGKGDRLVGELSHGDQRSTEIMMSIALKPRLLLLDEPTAGMGDQETYHVTKLIRSLHKDSKLTIMLVEHDMRVIFHLADRIMVLGEGSVLAEGTPDEIAKNEVVQAAYLGKAA